MTISQSFNGFYHALLTEFFNKTWSVSFREWKSNQGNGCMIFYKGVAGEGDYDCVASPKGTDFELDTSLKTIFKNMNTSYGMDGEKKISTTDIDNKSLCEHIDWVTKILNENGYEFEHDMAKWERIKREAGF